MFILKLNEFIANNYNCKFPERLCKSAINYYRKNSYTTRCLFIFDNMLEQGSYEVSADDANYMANDAPEVFSEMLEAFIFALWEDIKRGKRPRGFYVNLEN